MVWDLRSYASRRRLSFASKATVHIACGKAQRSRFRHATYEPDDALTSRCVVRPQNEGAAGLVASTIHRRSTLVCTHLDVFQAPCCVSQT